MRIWTLSRTMAALIVLLVPAAGADAAMPAKVCASKDGTDRAMCVTMIGAERTVLNDGKAVCSNVAPNDLSDTYAVMDFVRAHPERQEDELGKVTEEVLKKLHPCN
jgi:hypothetical protein